MQDRSSTQIVHSCFLIMAACIGNLLEWYDFAVYALFSPYIAQVIFPASSQKIQLVQSLLVFGIGTVARPAGALLIGIYADRRGRGAALFLTCLLMGLGTALIFCDPPYRIAGSISVAILVAARFLQGISAGGEIGGAVSYLAEQVPPSIKGLSASFLQGTMGLSNMLGAAIAASLTLLLSNQQIVQWGWRIPFAIGLAIIPVGLFLRHYIPSRPVDNGRILNSTNILKELFINHRASL